MEEEKKKIEEKCAGNNFIQTSDKGTLLDIVGATVTVSGSGLSWWSVTGTEKAKKPKNPYIPKEIWADEAAKVVIVKWDDGTEIKVTCDGVDVFSVEAGFAQALKYKVFGGKKQFKEKWSKIILRRTKFNTRPPEVYEEKIAKKLRKSKKG